MKKTNIFLLLSVLLLLNLSAEISLLDIPFCGVPGFGSDENCFAFKGGGNDFYIGWMYYNDTPFIIRVDSNLNFPDTFGFCATDTFYNVSGAFFTAHYNEGKIFAAWGDNREYWMDGNLYCCYFDSLGNKISSVKKIADDIFNAKTIFFEDKYYLFYETFLEGKLTLRCSVLDTVGNIITAKWLQEIKIGNSYDLISKNDKIYLVYDTGEYTDSMDVYCAIVNNDLTYRTKPVNNQPKTQYYPAVCSDGSKLIIIWLYRDTSISGYYRIEGATVDFEGQIVDSTLISFIGVGNRFNTSVKPSVASNGETFALSFANYVDYYQTNYVFLFNLDGSLIDTFRFFDEPDSGEIADVFITSLDSSYINLCVFNNPAIPSYNDVYVNRITDLTRQLENAGNCASLQCNYNQYQDFVNDGQNYFIAFENYMGSNSIYGVLIDSGFQALDSTPFLISDFQDYSKYPVVAFNGTDFITVWYRENYYLQFRRMTTEGVFLDPYPVQLNTPTRVGVSSDRSIDIACDSLNYVIVWQTYGDTTVYRMVSKDGNLVDSTENAVIASGVAPKITCGDGRFFIHTGRTLFIYDSQMTKICSLDINIASSFATDIEYKDSIVYFSHVSYFPDTIMHYYVSLSAYDTRTLTWKWKNIRVYEYEYFDETDLMLNENEILLSFNDRYKIGFCRFDYNGKLKSIHFTEENSFRKFKPQIFDKEGRLIFARPVSIKNYTYNRIMIDNFMLSCVEHAKDRTLPKDAIIEKSILCSKNLILKVTSPGEYNVEIYDKVGRKILKKKIFSENEGTYLIDLPEAISSGMYFIKLNDSIQKFILFE